MKKIISILSVLLVIAMTFCSCDANRGNSNNEGSNSEVINLISGGKAQYGIVRATSMSVGAVKAAGQLFSTICEATGVTVQYITDEYTLEDGAKEILIGNTTRNESLEIAESLGDGEYAIKIVGEKIVIVANEDETLVTAINKFVDICANGAADGELVIDANLDIKTSDPAWKPKEPEIYIPEGGKLVATTKLLPELSLTNHSSIGVGDSSVGVQGGCIAKGYLFSFLAVTATSEKAWVVKTNLNNPSDQTVKRIGANLVPTKFPYDAIYIPEKDVIYVSVGKGFEMIDPDTLEELGSVKIALSDNMDDAFGVKSFGYDEYNDKYYGHDGNFIYCYNGDLDEILREMPTTVSAGYKYQGGLCDSKYFYSLECADNNTANNLKIYDLESGKVVHKIDLGIRCEAENIAYYDGSFYITCNNFNWNGRLVYKVDIAAKS